MKSMNIYDAVKIALTEVNSGRSNSQVYFAARLTVTTKEGNELTFQLFADKPFTPADVLGAEVGSGCTVALMYVHDVQSIRTVNRVHCATRWVEIEIVSRASTFEVTAFLPDGVEFPAEVVLFHAGA